MSRFMPYILMAVILFMLVISWKNVLGYYSSITESYQTHIEKAEAYMEKKIYIDAVGEYESALNIKSDDYDTAMKVVDLYEKLDNYNGWIKACQNAISADRTRLDPYLMLADYYIEKSQLSSAYDTLKEAEKNLGDTPEVTSRLIDIMGRYTLEGLRYDKMTPFFYSDNLKTGYAVVSSDDKKGLINTSKSVTVSAEYDDIGIPGQEVIPVYQDKEWYYINEDEYRKLVPDTKADYLGTFHDNYAPAEINGVYGYLNKKMEEFHFEYEYAGCFSNGLAAVKKDGKWAVINTSFTPVTGFDFDEILLDEYGFCSTYGVFFAKQNNQYYLYNSNGEQTSEGFEDVKLFASDEPAAVKKNGKWGFVSKAGETVTEFTYENADSFSLGFAPYCEKGKWGCVDQKGNVLITPVFDAMKPFSHNGYALVETNGIQELAVITIYE